MQKILNVNNYYMYLPFKILCQTNIQHKNYEQKNTCLRLKGQNIGQVFLAITYERERQMKNLKLVTFGSFKISVCGKTIFFFKFSV